MPRAVLLLVTVGVAIYALVDLLRSRPDEVRGLPRFAWILAIVILPLAGSVAYLLLGRVGAGMDKGGAGSGPRVIAPDDDPDFLRSLEADERRRQRRSPDDPDDPDDVTA